MARVSAWDSHPGVLLTGSLFWKTPCQPGCPGEGVLCEITSVRGALALALTVRPSSDYPPLLSLCEGPGVPPAHLPAVGLD